MKLLLLFLVTTPITAYADPYPYPDFDGRGPVTAECLSSNRFGQRVLGRGIDQQSAFQESLYQCYLRAGEFGARSCRVDVCRAIGGVWKRLQ